MYDNGLINDLNTIILRPIVIMDSGSKKFRETQNIQLTDTITCTASSKEYLLAATLDDTLTVWKNNNVSGFEKEPIINWNSCATGIIDAKFSPNSTQLAVSSMDSFIRIWELQSNKMSTIECPPMSLWKLEFVGENIAVCGDLGRINFYDMTSKQNVKKIDAGDIFLSSLTQSNSGLLAAGDSFGGVHIINIKKKNQKIDLKAHHRAIQRLSFTQDSSKLISASEDSTLKIIDISSEKIIGSLEGHKETVSCVKTDLNDSRIAYSCSFDKSLKSWDLRMKTCIDTFQTGSPLWSLQTTGKNIFAGGQNGVLSSFSLQ